MAMLLTMKDYLVQIQTTINLLNEVEEVEEVKLLEEFENAGTAVEDISVVVTRLESMAYRLQQNAITPDDFAAAWEDWIETTVDVVEAICAED